MLKQLSFIELFDVFISESRKGRRLKKDGTLIRRGTIKQYEVVRNELVVFCGTQSFELRVKNLSRANTRLLKSERLYWKRFYKRYTDYMYAKGCFDNYVGLHIKTIRTFFNYLKSEKGINCGDFHKTFYVRSEQIPVVVLSPVQLQFLINDKAFEARLPTYLKQTKDIFVFGCTVCLRFSDLMAIKSSHLEKTATAWHLKVRSIKTSTDTRIKLPGYAVEILRRQRTAKTLLPGISCSRLNYNVKELCAEAGWTQEVNKSRQRRGVVKKIATNGKPVRFCDLVTTHTMRRTAITTMLCLGMPESMVRKLSGHSANSKDFFRYVEYAQQWIDRETDRVFSALSPVEKPVENI
ncbi:MAG TPA: tyrosine-type recombinase/integrase [Chitinophagales bacterium]|nr:tyrosine-type recombinase/integrase [Chitinophagales bacterium]